MYSVTIEMNESVGEDCVICWRSFSATVIPITLICGHSFCQECSTDLNKCPLCRKKLKRGYSRPTNYSLLSLLNRIELQDKKETHDKEVQTEEQKRTYTRRSTQTAPADKTASFVALAIIGKLTKIQHMLLQTCKGNSNQQPN